MRSINASQNRPTHNQQKPPRSLKSHKSLILLVVVVFLTIISSIGGYLIGIKTRQELPIPKLSLSAHPPTITQSPIDIMPEQAMSTVTKKQVNPSGTLAFYFTSQKPAFGPNDDPQDIHWINDDPFKVCFNGDTFYSIPSTAYHGSTDKYVITPYIIEMDSRESYALPFIGKIKAPNGCVRIISWVDDNHLLREACGGDLNESCHCHLIDVRKLSLKDLGDTESTRCLLTDKK